MQRKKWVIMRGMCLGLCRQWNNQTMLRLDLAKCYRLYFPLLQLYFNHINTNFNHSIFPFIKTCIVWKNVRIEEKKVQGNMHNVTLKISPKKRNLKKSGGLKRFLFCIHAPFSSTEKYLHLHRHHYQQDHRPVSLRWFLESKWGKTRWKETKRSKISRLWTPFCQRSLQKQRTWNVSLISKMSISVIA